MWAYVTDKQQFCNMQYSSLRNPLKFVERFLVIQSQALDIKPF